MKYALALLMVGLFSLSALARMPGPENRVEHLANALELSDEQTAQVETIVSSKQEQMQKLMQQLATLRQETDTEIKAVLTKEQVEKFESMQRNRPQGRGPAQEF